eukprot:CAMPEP_0172689298 /NCGR_PEP_ID=MMETSP1074-20121228/23045_1 /TAXON_ID=2916 /ORGANISM="Ceratium fusus, Strain PA161109" /LENGTH=131 /DNA_ID=CAMNT_0013509089 /DNA_START=68 /DNA_END=463 /DNA_ORIENTATION=+
MTRTAHLLTRAASRDSHEVMRSALLLLHPQCSKWLMTQNIKVDASVTTNSIKPWAVAVPDTSGEFVVLAGVVVARTICGCPTVATDTFTSEKLVPASFLVKASTSCDVFEPKSETLFLTAFVLFPAGTEML